MTGPPQGSDGSPSVAALAVHVNGLRREVESLATKVDTEWALRCLQVLADVSCVG